ncbi:MAG: hypothetical protein IJ520_10145, partial [Synergistaceae bacterium]|nr:hypothetical protein [Synergistaceae bacterium]
MKKFNINIKLLMLSMLIAACWAVTAEAAKWESMTLSENLQDDIKKLEDYCLLHDVKLNDVLWANNLSEETLQPGQKILLPKSQIDLLSLWQNQGSWQPKALVQKTSAAAAERARGSSGYPPKQPVQAQAQAQNNLPPVQTQAQAKKNNNSYRTAAEAEILAQLSNRPEPIKPKIKDNITQVNKASQPEAEILAQLSNRPEPIKPKVKDNITQANKTSQPEAEILAQLRNKPEPIKPKIKDNNITQANKTSQPEPVILLSPNGDPVNGPMRLVIT